MPVIRWRVVCGLLEVMLSLQPTRWFSSVDLPTLGRPTIATVPARCSDTVSDLDCTLVGLARGRLFGSAATGALPEGADTELWDGAFDLELLFVCLAAGGHDSVLGQRQPASLQIFLEQGLGILA